MNETEHVVIVGGGMAGANAAVALRDEGFEGRVTILGEEQEWPYERPPLSKGYLRGEEELAKAYVRQPADYEDLKHRCPPRRRRYWARSGRADRGDRCGQRGV